MEQVACQKGNTASLEYGNGRLTKDKRDGGRAENHIVNSLLALYLPYH